MLDRLLFASLQGLVALAGVGAICLLFKRMPANWKVWLWRLAMLKMAVALCFPAPTLRVLPATVSPAAVIPRNEGSQSVVAAKSSNQTFGTVGHSTITGLEPTPSHAAGPGELERKPTINRFTQQVASSVSPQGVEPAASASFPLWAALWLVGTALMCSIALVALWQARRTATKTHPVHSSEAQGEAREAAERIGLRTQPALRSFNNAGSPFVTGLLRPLVAVPEALLNNLRELRLTLLHEFAHLRRGDLRWSFAMNLLRALFWFHPLAWIAEREHRVQSEIACDAFVVCSGEDRREYALALVRMATAGGPHCGTALLGAVGSRRALLRRLHEMSKPNTRSLKLRTALAIGLPAAALLIPIQLAARSPQMAPESDPSVPLVVPAISPDNLDDITLPALEKLPAPSEKELKSRIDEIRLASFENPQDVDRQMVALMTLQDTDMSKLTPQQKSEVERALKQAMEDLHRALNEELPKAMAEAQKAQGQKVDQEALRAQIEKSVRIAMNAARQAMDQVRSGKDDRVHLKVNGRALQGMPPEARIEMEKALSQLKDLDKAKFGMDENARKEMEKALGQMKSLDLSTAKMDAQLRAELEKSMAQLRDMRVEIKGLPLDDKAREELKRAGVDPSSIPNLKSFYSAGGLNGNEGIVIAGDGKHSVEIKGQGSDNHLIWDGKGELTFNGKKLHVKDGRAYDENGKEMPNVKITTVPKMTMRPFGDAKGNQFYMQPNAPGAKVWTFSKDGKTWSYAMPAVPDAKILRRGQMPPAIAAPLAPGRTWSYTIPAVPDVKVLREGRMPMTLSAPDAKALRLFYGDPKKLSPEQRERLRKIDAEIQKLMRERAKLAPGYAPMMPSRSKSNSELSPSSDDFLRNNYPSLFPPSGPQSSDEGELKGA